uniref:CCT-beta n=1 Tax=Coccolithus braarudii TaxID=221442 RepID=A0A7S0LGV3_9EUKA
MDKILQSVGRGNMVSVTNDGATILKSVLIDNPAAKVLIDISKVQDDEVGDGTTSVCVLAGELLRQAAELIEKKMHPQTVIAGYRLARDAALTALNAAAIDHSADAEKFRADLINIAKTTLSSKVLSADKELFSEIAVSAVLKLRGSTNLDQIQIIKRIGGSLRDSYLDADGFLLDKRIGVGCPKRMTDCKVLVANTPMDTDKVKIYGSKVKVDSVSKVAEIEAAEKQKMLDKVDRILSHGCNVFVNRQLIYNLPEQRLADAGVMSIEHADFDGIERLGLVLSGDIISTFDTPEQVKLGKCDLIEEVMIGEDKLVRFSGCPNSQASSIVIRGANTHVVDEAQRSLHDALCVLSQTVRNTSVLPGGGAPEMLMAQAVEEASKKVASKHVVAMEAYAKALRMMPMHIADNAGYDSTELCAGLRAKHYEGAHSWGLEMEKGGLADMAELGIMEALKVKQQVLLSSSEAAEMILRVDDIVQCAPRKRDEQNM